MITRLIFAALTLFALGSCAQMAPQPAEPGTGHLKAGPVRDADIPEVVRSAPFVPPPATVPESERYTVVVNDVPVRELLFALARDAELNVDIAGDVSGNVTLNAIDQTLPQILDRIARQVDLRHRVEGGTIVVSPDNPYFRTYDVGYVNLSRDVETTVNVATRVATTGGGSIDDTGGGGGSGSGRGGNNTSSTRLNSHSYNRFWETLYENVLAILGQSEERSADRGSDDVIINAEAGMLTIRANSDQHRMLEGYIDKVLVNARRQVMIEATIVEVSLNDQYQAGVDWSVLLRPDEEGFAVDQNILGASTTDGVIDAAISSFLFGYVDPDLGGHSVDVTVRLLREFGETRVLSSPRLMVLNNQTAMLKVVQELVYFTVEVTDKDSTVTQQGRTIIESDVHSVPVGLVMAVTPQISDNNEITLTVRPTISQKVGDAIDPAIQLAAQSVGTTGVTSTVPVIRVREMESVLKLVDGQIGVLGGLMQDEIRDADREVPFLANLPLLGEFFGVDEYQTTKTELVIFLRPVVVRDPSIETDLEPYREFLRTSATR